MTSLFLNRVTKVKQSIAETTFSSVSMILGVETVSSLHAAFYHLVLSYSTYEISVIVWRGYLKPDSAAPLSFQHFMVTFHLLFSCLFSYFTLHSHCAHGIIFSHSRELLKSSMHYPLCTRYPQLRQNQQLAGEHTAGFNSLVTRYFSPEQAENKKKSG